MRILRHAEGRRQVLNGALGIFGLDSRAACFRRVRRLLDTERPIRPAPGAWSLWALILLAVVLLPHLRAASDAIPVNPQKPAAESATLGQRDAKAATDKARAQEVQEFALRVVGPDGKPIPEAVIMLRTNPGLTAEPVRRGKLVKRGPYDEVFVVTDAQGQLAVGIPQAPTYFFVYIETPGYGPYWAGWSSESHDEPIPTRFTAELEAAWSVGGIIVNAEGKPVEGVTISPRIDCKTRPGDHRHIGGGTDQKTDAAGRWHFDSVPVSTNEVFVEIHHPAFSPLRRQLTRAEFGIEHGRQPVAKIVLDRGLTVTGKVTDEAGKPIAGALVRTQFFNVIREARTGPDGVYHLAGCEPRTARIVVSAKGRATDMQELRHRPRDGAGRLRDEARRHRAHPRSGPARKTGPQGAHLLPAVARRLLPLRIRPRRSICRPEWRLGVERSTAGRIQGEHLAPPATG